LEVYASRKGLAQFDHGQIGVGNLWGQYSLRDNLHPGAVCILSAVACTLAGFCGSSALPGHRYGHGLY